MGIDFVRKCARSFERSWDRNLDQLAQPSLFNVEPEVQEQTYRAIAQDGLAFAPGEKFLVQLDGEIIRLCKQVSVVAIIHEPTRGLLEAIAKANGVAVGTVQRVLVDGSAADISVSDK